MIYFVTLLGFVLAALVFHFRAEKVGSNLYLAIFIFFNSFYALTSFSFYSEDFHTIFTKLYPYIIIPNMAAGPFMYFYFLSILKPNFKFKRIYFLHFLPALLFFINGSNAFMESNDAKGNIIQFYFKDVHNAYSMPTLVLHYYWHVVFRIGQTIVYFLASFRLFFLSIKANGFNLTNENQIPYGYFSLFFLFFLGHYFTSLMVGLSVNPIFGNVFSAGNGIEILSTTSRSFFTLFIFTSLFNPKIIFEKYFTPPTKSFVRRTKQKVDFDFNLPDSGRYDLLEIDRVFREYMVSKPYLQSGFSLSTLSEDLKTPVHQISYYIKNRYNLTFNEWKNEVRIHHAVGMINEGLADNLTLESISIQCGYRSRANFVDAFKKVLNQMPSEYLTKYKNRANNASQRFDA